MGVAGAVAFLVVGIGLAGAQTLPRPNVPNAVVPASSADYVLLRTATNIYRYDTRTGRSELFAMNGSSATWAPMLDIAATPPPGEVGRYEILEGHSGAALMVRIDRKTGRTWRLGATSMGSAWVEATKQ